MQYITKQERIAMLFERLQTLPPAHNGLEAYKQVSITLNDIEDEVFGTDHWAPPRTFRRGQKTERLYPTYPENFHSVAGYAGVMQLVHHNEIIFISRFGAIEIRTHSLSSHDSSQRCEAMTVFSKLDAYGDGIWIAKNRK